MKKKIVNLKHFLMNYFHHPLVRNLSLLKEFPFDYKKYWGERNDRFGFNILYCCGNEGQTKDENYEWYNIAGQHITEVIKKIGLDNNCQILDAGCGIGFYANIFYKLGYKNYTGLDLNQDFINELNNKGLQGYKFEQKDIFKQWVAGKYDIITLIWVTGHIIRDKDFYLVMNNIKNSLNEGGYFLVTDKIDKDVRENFFVRRRTLDYYKKVFGEPVEIVQDFLFNRIQLLIFRK